MFGAKLRFNLVPLLVCVLAAGGICMAAFSRADDVSGTWDLAVESRQGTARPSVTFKQNGEILSGTYRGRMGEVALQGTLKAGRIQFTVKLKFRDQDIQVTYTGVVESDTMRGSVQFGDSGSGTWTARRRGGS